MSRLNIFIQNPIHQTMIDPHALESLQFPIGRFSYPQTIPFEETQQHLSVLRNFPQLLEEVARKLTDSQLDTPYRPEGWTTRQVVHHLADSHLNAYCRMKMALTEDNPTILPYQENLWAELPEARNTAIEPSLLIIKGVHQRWVATLEAISAEDFARAFNHPEYTRLVSIAQQTALYAWHSKHHLAHIKLVLK